MSNHRKNDFLEQNKALQTYMQQVKRHKRISKEEERELALRYKEKNDQNAFNNLVEANLRYVVKMAMKYRYYPNVDILDLIQEGNLGLMRAVRNFDASRNVSLVYFAHMYIQEYMRRKIYKNFSLVKMPAGANNINKIIFFQLSGKYANLSEDSSEEFVKKAAKDMNVPEEAVRYVQSLEEYNHCHSLSASPIIHHKENRESFEAFLLCDANRTQKSAEEYVHDKSRKKFFKKILNEIFEKNVLLGKEKEFVSRHVAEPEKTQVKIAEDMNVRRQRISTLQKESSKKIQQYIKKNYPEEVLSES